MGQSKKINRIVLASVASLSMTMFFGCGPGGQGQSSSASETFGSVDPSTPTLGGVTTVAKVYYDQATLEQLIPHKAECSGNPHETKVCIQICHVPPGNPAAAKSKVLPLSAMKAHMGHGDYLGECEAAVVPTPTPAPSPTPSDSTGSTDGSTGGTGATDPTGTTDPNGTTDPSETTDPTDGIDPLDPFQNGTIPTDGSGGETPQWCVPYLPIDANCDGLNDATGESYF